MLHFAPPVHVELQHTLSMQARPPAQSVTVLHGEPAVPAGMHAVPLHL
jgi:hypothetical protein